MSRRPAPFERLPSVCAIVGAALFAAPLQTEPARGQTPGLNEGFEIGLSTDEIGITSDFSGTRLVVFGALDNADAQLLRQQRYDIVVALVGPRRGVVVREKERTLGLWINRGSESFDAAPASYALASTRPLADITRENLRVSLSIGIDDMRLNTGSAVRSGEGPADGASAPGEAPSLASSTSSTPTPDEDRPPVESPAGPTAPPIGDAFVAGGQATAGLDRPEASIGKPGSDDTPSPGDAGASDPATMAAGPRRQDILGSVANRDRYAEALRRIREGSGLYNQRIGGVEFVSPTLFRADLRLPADLPVGQHVVRAYLFRSGVFIREKSEPLSVVKTGFESVVDDFANRYGFLYGLFAVALAIFTGWFGRIVFKRD